MKRFRKCVVILMLLNLLSSLFGCSGKTEYGQWSGFTVSNQSSDRMYSYRFTVTVLDNGGMTINGYCFIDETEYRVDEYMYLSSNAAYDIRHIGIENFPSQSSKKIGLFGKPADKDQKSFTVTHTDGTTREIEIPDDKLNNLIGLLGDELKFSVQSLSHGEWRKLMLSYTGSDDYSDWYDLTLELNTDGKWILSGYCPDSDGIRCENEDGVEISKETVSAVKALELERLAAYRPAEPDPEMAEVMILDAGNSEFKLVFEDGYTEEKTIYSDMKDSLYKLLKDEFLRKAEIR